MTRVPTALAAAVSETRRARAKQLTAAAVADGRISRRGRQAWEDAVTASATAARELADLAPITLPTVPSWDL